MSKVSQMVGALEAVAVSSCVRSMSVPPRGLDRLLVGRGENCDFTVRDESVSRHHAEIARFENRYVVRDLGSTNARSSATVEIPTWSGALTARTR